MFQNMFAKDVSLFIPKSSQKVLAPKKWYRKYIFQTNPSWSIRVIFHILSHMFYGFFYWENSSTENSLGNGLRWYHHLSVGPVGLSKRLRGFVICKKKQKSKVG